MTDRRFTLTEDYKGNFSVPILDKTRLYDEMMITEVVYELNNLYKEQQKVKETLQKRYNHLLNCQQETEKPPRYWQGAIMELEVIADGLGVDLK